MIRDLFPAVELLNSIPPDEVIPIGAAIEAGILIGKESLSVEDALQIECSAKDILVKVCLACLYFSIHGIKLLPQVYIHMVFKIKPCTGKNFKFRFIILLVMSF